VCGGGGGGGNHRVIDRVRLGRVLRDMEACAPAAGAAQGRALPRTASSGSSRPACSALSRRDAAPQAGRARGGRLARGRRRGRRSPPSPRRAPTRSARASRPRWPRPRMGSSSWAAAATR